jgi:hypothetical protein
VNDHKHQKRQRRSHESFAHLASFAREVRFIARHNPATDKGNGGFLGAWT